MQRAMDGVYLEEMPTQVTRYIYYQMIADTQTYRLRSDDSLKFLETKLPENIVQFGFGQTEDLGWLALRCCPVTI